MRCDLCGRKAVAEVHYLKKYFCDRCFTKMYERKIRRTIRNSNMLDKNDKIMAAVSGGKDSLVLLYTLWKKHLDVTAMTVDEGIKGYRDESVKYVKKFCEEHDIPLVIKTYKEEYGFTLDDLATHNKQKSLLAPQNALHSVGKINKPMCSYCGVFRRDLMNKTARELKVGKVATGHNLDDEAQSVTMNFFRGELKRLARMGPVTGVIKHPMFIPRVKPLMECLEKENITYALIKGIEYEDMECPYRHDAYRNTARDVLNELERKYPGTKINVMRNLEQMLPILKEKFKGAEEPKLCEQCGEVTTQRICSKCKLVKEAKRLMNG